MTRVLITGGCGFIGSNLIEFILEKTGWEITVLDNLSTGKKEDIEDIKGFSERCTLVQGDIRNQEDVDNTIEGCDFVVNLAAQAGVIPSINDPLLDADINIKGLINVLRSCVDKKIKKVVHASSAAPLGEQEMPLTESKIPKPLSPYGASKLAGEGYCSAFAASYGLNVVALRFSNVYGPKSYAKGSVISLFIKQALKGNPLTVYSDGSQTRDFVYVLDVCNAIYLALSASLENNFELFQIATGTETTINELIEALKKEIENNSLAFPEVNNEPARPGEIQKNYADISKSRRLLHYQPETTLPEGLKKTIAWFLEKK